MGEPAANIQDSSMEDLAAQIESLLGTADSAAPPPAHAPVHPTDKSGLPHHAPPPEEGDMEPEDLGAAVEKMLAQAMAQVEELGEVSTAAAKEIPFHLPDEPPAPPAEDLAGSLEDELTALAEQLDAQPPPAAAAATPPDPEPEAHVADDAPGAEAAPKVAAKPEAVGKAGVVAALAAWSSQDRNKVAPEHSAPAEHATTPTESVQPAAPVAAAPVSATPAPTPAPVAAPAPAPAPQPTVQPAVPRTPWLKPLLIKSARAIGKPVVVVAEVTVKVLAKPLAGAKPVVRDSVGWIAVVTLFMGGCMWAAVLLRNPKPFVPAVAPVTLVAAGEGGEGGGHGGAKAAGGHKEAKPAGHGEAKGGHDKKPAAKHEEAKAEGHGGGAAKPPVKREPLIQRGPAAAKKPAKKPEGHGE